MNENKAKMKASSAGSADVNAAEKLGDFTTTIRVIPITLIAMVIGCFWRRMWLGCS